MNNELRTENEGWLEVWGQDWLLAGCANCNGVFVLSPEKASHRCPYCGQEALSQMDPGADQPIYTQPPELVVPFQADEARLRQRVARFAKSSWLAPADLSEAVLLERLQPIYLPMWLVDAQVQGEWQAEMGFNYEIVTHREEYENNRWQSERVKEGRVRWEPRLGRLNRSYDNQVAPALEEQSLVEAQIGRFNLKEPKPFQPDHLHGAIVRLPNRPPEDAWSEAVLTLQTAVAQDCQRASEADHIRGFKWSPRFANQQWSQLLLPLYTSYYLDDDNQAHMVLLHGQTGQLHGTRRASMKRALQTTSMILKAAFVLLLLTAALSVLGSLFDVVVTPWAEMLGALAVSVGGTAVLPLVYAWYINTIKAQTAV